MDNEKKKILTSADIIELFNKKNIDNDWSFKGVNPSQTCKWSHDFHRYPAKFIPQLVEKLVDEYIESKDAHINDPFLGSGTTIVTAISRGFKASGTDINEIAFLMTKVKATPINPGYLTEKISHVIKRLNFLQDMQGKSFTENLQPFIPQQHIQRIDYWLTPANKFELGIILHAIYDEPDQVIRAIEY